MRLRATARSHILTHFTETLHGDSSIRAYGQTDICIAEANDRINNSTALTYAAIVTSR